MNQQLLEYIGSQLDRGVQEEAVYDALVAKGWPEESVQDAFTTIYELEAQDYEATRQAAPAAHSLISPTPGFLEYMLKDAPPAPLPITVLSVVLLLTAGISLLASFPVLLTGTSGGVSSLVIGLINFINGLGGVAIAFGLRYLKRWAVSVFTILSGLLLIGMAIDAVSSQDVVRLVNPIMVIQLVAVGYVWTQRDKFTY